MADNHVLLLGFLTEEQRVKVNAPTHFFVPQESMNEWHDLLEAIGKKGYKGAMSLFALLLKYSYNHMEHQADHAEMGSTCLIHIFAFTSENRQALHEFAFNG